MTDTALWLALARDAVLLSAGADPEPSCYLDLLRVALELKRASTKKEEELAKLRQENYDLKVRYTPRLLRPED